MTFVYGFLLLWLPVALGIEVGSEQGTMFAYASAMDPLGIRFYLSGADATPSFGQTTATDTKCYTGVGRAGVGLERKLFAEPSICLDMIFSPSGGSSTANAKGILAAMDAQNQPQLYTIDYSNYQISLQEPHGLPLDHFPVLLVLDPPKTYVYVAMHPTHGRENRITTKDDDDNRVNLPSTHDYLMQLSHPRFTTLDQPGDLGYSPVIIKYNLQTRQEEWRFEVTTINGKTLLTGMAVVDTDRLVIFGSSTGNVLVDGSKAITGPGPNTVGDRWDGFLIWANPQTGTVDLTDYSSPEHNNLGGSIRSQLTADDYILGVCFDDDKAYVVGHTTGKFQGTQAGGAFVIKLDTHGRDFTWTRQFVGDGLEFTHCTVRGDGRTVLVAGHAAAASAPLAPRNGNDAYTGPATQDIILVEMDTGNGKTKYTRQIDSHRNDHLVGLELRGGTGPQKDTVYLASNAWDWDAQPIPTNDLFVITIDATGDHEWMNIDPTLDPITMLKDGTLANDNVDPLPPLAPSPAPPPLLQPSPPSATGLEASDENSPPTLAIVIPILLVVALTVVVVSLLVWRRRRSSSSSSSRATIENMAHVVGNHATTSQPQAEQGGNDDVESLASENKIM